MSAARWVAGLLVLFAGGSVRAQDALGFAELRASWLPGASGKRWQLVERVRPTLQAELSERVKLVATVEAGLAQGRDLTEELERALRASDFGPLLEAADCRWPTHANSVLRVDQADDYLDVDRLHVDVYGRAFDLRVGRQALQWGSARFFNPTDPFPEVLLAEPWRPRRGVNSARLNVPFGEASDVSAVVAVNDALEAVRAAGRLRLNWAGTDLALVGAWRGGSARGLVGVDLRGTLGVGWWVEAAFFPGKGAHAELALGVDYSFPVLERLDLFAQYYRNSAGASHPDRYQRLGGLSQVTAPECAAGEFSLGPTRQDPFAPFTVGRDYLIAGAAVGILPDLSLSLIALQNLNDGTGMTVPTLTYNARGWLDVAFSAQVPYAAWGGGGEFKPRPQDLRIERELGPPLGSVSADLSGLVPDATLTLWTRASF
jgi:hypothetical protein